MSITTGSYGMNSIDISECVGKRILVHPNSYSSTPEEWLVIEISPSGDYVKVQYETGATSWLEAKYIYVREILPDKVSKR